MIIPHLEFDPAPFERISASASALPERFEANLRKRMPRLKSDILTITAVIPGPVQYPIQWKSPKQAYWFFRTKGFGKGIPTGRVEEPGGVLGGYDVTLAATAGGGQIDLTNDYPNAVFIVGEHQQPFHEVTGWVQVDNVMPENQALAVDAVFATWDETVKELL